MMRAMRANAKWIMLFIAIAFVGWMIFDVGMGIAGQGTGVSVTDAVAQVNGAKIDLQTYYQAIRNANEQQRQQFGSVPVSLEDQRALEDAVLENLIQEVLLAQEYRRRGIRVSNDEIVQAARTSPPPDIMAAEIFQTDGQFDLSKYQRYIASNQNPEFLFALEERYRAEIPRFKLFDQLVAGVYVSDSKLWQSYRDQNDSITLRVIQIRPGLAVPDSQVSASDEEIRRYFVAHPDEFERPAVAFLSYLRLSRQTHAEDSAAALARAIALKGEIDGGTDFADVARRESADSTSRVNGGDLGVQPNDRFIPEFTDAARALRVGRVSDPILTNFGYHIIKLERVTRDSLHPRHILVPIELAGDHLDEVESRADTMDLLAAEQTDPLALDDVAEMLGVPVRQAPPATEGRRLFLEGEVVPDASLWAFDAVPGETSRVVETPGAFYTFRLDSVRAAGVPPLEDVRASVRQAVMMEKKWEIARQQANTIRDDLRGGQPLMEAAVFHLQSANTLGPMTRANPTPALQRYPEVVGRGFGLGVGEASDPIETDDAIFLVEPASIQLADSTAFVEQIDQQREEAVLRARQNTVQLFLLSLRSGADVWDGRRQVERAQRELETRLDDPQNPFNPLGF